MTTAVALARFEGLPAREIYQTWTWSEVWKQLGVHLAFHYGTG